MARSAREPPKLSEIGVKNKPRLWRKPIASAMTAPAAMMTIQSGRPKALASFCRAPSGWPAVLPFIDIF